MERILPMAPPIGSDYSPHSHSRIAAMTCVMCSTLLPKRSSLPTTTSPVW